jgi:hypothetical protein
MGSPFITGQTLSSPRSNFTGTVGFKLNVTAGGNITVDSIGRWVIAGNNLTHVLTIWDWTAAAVIATVTVNCSGATAGQYLYGSITPTTLVAGHAYSFESAELSGGDSFYDAPVSVTRDPSVLATIQSAVFNHTNLTATTDQTYVPVNFTVSTGTGATSETLSDSLSFNDSISTLLLGVTPLTASDSLSLSDSIATVLWGVNTINVSDSLALSDNIQSLLDYIISDSLSLSDSIKLIKAVIVIINDSLSFSDSLIYTGALIEQFVDRLVLTDSILLNAPNNTPVGDTLTLSDNARIVLGINQILSDLLSLSDSVIIQLNTVIQIVVSDAITLSDSLSFLTNTALDNYLRHYLNDVQGIRTPETITDPAIEDPNALNDYLRRYLNDKS